MIGNTDSEPIRVDSAGITVCELPIYRGIMNQVTQTVDAAGRVHVVLWMQPPDAADGSADMRTWRYVHFRRELDGSWHERQLPYVGRKPSVVADAHDNLVLVFTKPDDPEYHGVDPGGPLYVLCATMASGWSDWRVLHHVADPFVGEPRIDEYRWRESGVLSVYAQRAPERPGAPSELRVLDFD